MTLQEWILTILICSCILFALVMMACMLMMRRAKRLTTVQQTVNGHPEHPCVFAFISDLHVAHLAVPWGNIVDTLVDAHPEFVLITGDLCNRIEETGRAACFIDLLAAKVRVPIYITLGNHDNGIFREQPALRRAFIQELEALSPLVRVVDNDFVLHRDVLIGGLDDVHTAPHNAGALVTQWGELAASKNLPFILATHNADLLLQLAQVPVALRPALTVCGHTHGGQIRTPFNLEFALLKQDILPKKGYFYGRLNYEGFPLYITSGLGCSLLPIRSGSNAEVVIFHLC